MHDDTTLAPNRTIAERVEAYQSAAANIREAYAILTEAQKTLDDVFGKNGWSYSSFDVLPHHRTYNVTEAPAEVLTEIKRKIWHNLIDMSGIRKILSVKRAEELDKKLSGGELDEITHENVIGMIDMLRNSSADYTEEAVKEVYDMLRPGASYYNRHKTNKKNGSWRLDKKIILTGVLDTWFSGTFRINHYYDDKLRAIDRVFHMLDGKGMPGGYMCPLMDAIQTSQDGTGETEYFAFTGYGNGNLHLSFKRMDLVQRLNQIAGGGYVLKD